MEKVSVTAYGSSPDRGDAIERHHRRLIEEEAAARAAVGMRQMLATVPKKFRDARLGNYRPKNESQRNALDITEEWVRMVLDGHPALLALLGPTGVGKSHLLYGAGWALFEATNTVPLCIRWYRFPNELRYGRGPRDERGEMMVQPWEVRREWEQAPICLIDEARRTSGTEFDATELAMYTLGAYDDEKAVILTCSRGRLEAIIGEEPANRFTIAHIEGESFRDVEQ